MVVTGGAVVVVTGGTVVGGGGFGAHFNVRDKPVPLTVNRGPAHETVPVSPAANANDCDEAPDGIAEPTPTNAAAARTMAPTRHPRTRITKR